ncbi:hypothetical protein NDU88_009077 [Pleurodeles waltl]|uniref:Uncharacterized protein n=1 Tax=Pleurodeles waltl TaxID=8319 RepID=A0AAV7PTZ3_PLEWA|nr:hypothetical protein NDU88_009077 [Pleurodeles waltl]
MERESDGGAQRQPAMIKHIELLTCKMAGLTGAAARPEQPREDRTQLPEAAESGQRERDSREVRGQNVQG